MRLPSCLDKLFHILNFKMQFSDQEKIPISEKLEHLNWLLIFMITVLASIGFLMLYSAGGGNLRPWLIKQLIFFCIFFVVMIGIALTDIKIWFRFSYLFYAIALAMVITVNIMGHNAMGATRWFRIGSLTVQPSEIMKICTVFAMARYFYNIEADKIGQAKFLIIPVLMIAVPVLFIFSQPDLGTATILALVGVSVLFLAGVKTWKFVFVGVSALIAIPFLWIFLLYDYQKQRILTFLDPDNDPLGSGYNIIQSKIAIGSGGITGKGFLNGTQGQLNFLPEKQTDFIFTMLSEELGFIGSIFTIATYAIIIGIGIYISMTTKHQYGRLLTMGIINIFFVHMFINMGMVTGLLPVVGAPLPLISYGGTITASMLIGFGLVLNVDLNKNFDFTAR